MKNRTTRQLTIGLVCIALQLLVAPIDAAGADNKAVDAPTIAQQYIAEFERGEEFHVDKRWADLRIQDLVDESSLALLTSELANGTHPVRRNVFYLLKEAGLELDSPAPGKPRVIRSHAIIQALLVGGLAQSDDTFDQVLRALMDNCRPQDLAAFSGLYIESFKRSESHFFLLAAKAKTFEARAYVEAMAQSPKWQNSKKPRNTLRIAQAALGSAAVEQSFIDAVRDAEARMPDGEKDATEVAKRLTDLGLVGTRRTLRLACAYLRSPLKSFVRGVSERSLRYDALEAIRYNFPDEATLVPGDSTEAWSAAEAFCTQHMGAVFHGPTPHWKLDEGYPDLFEH